MPRLYKVAASMPVTIAGGNTDFLQLTAATGKPIRLVGFRLGNSTDVQDAGEMGLELQLVHMTGGTLTDGGGTGSTLITPTTVPRPAIGQAAGFTARVNSPTIATSTGTTTVLEYVGWINRSTPLDVFYPEQKWCCEATGGEALILRYTGTLTSDMTMQLTVFVEEEG